MQVEEEKRLAAAAHTDPQAFAKLYDRTVDRIYAYAVRQVQDGAAAQDVTAVTYEKALRALRQQPWQGESFIAWLYTIARNEAMTHHRKRRRLLPWQAAQSQPHSNGRETETAVFRTEQQRQLHRAIQQLPPNDQEVIALRYFEALSSDDVAAVLGCSTNAVYSRLHRALKKLEKQLDISALEGATTHV